MKKIRFLSVIIILFLTNIIPVKTSYNVSVGMTIPYDVIESKWAFEFNHEQSSGSGFSFKEVHYSNNTFTTVHVDSVSSTKVDFTVTIGTASLSDSIDHIENIIGYSLLLYFPSLITGTLNPWNQTKMDFGRGLVRSYFIDYSNMDSVFKEWSDDFYLESTFDRSDYVINRISGDYRIENDLAIYNYLLDCTIIGSSGLDTYSGNYTFQVVYNTVTSIIHGFELYHNYSGYRDADYYSVYYYYKAEKVGYNLPEFYFVVDETPTPTFLINIFTRTIISSCAIVFGILFTKRKIKK